jgi:chromate transport protein ChrA
MQHPWLQRFGRGAAPAVVGLLVVTALHLGRNAFSSEAHVGIASIALALAIWTKLHPIVILLGGAIIGAVYGLLQGIETL